MAEAVARAVGAASGVTVTIAGKLCTIRPLGLRQLCEIERDCLQRYKRQYLETYTANLDLLPDTIRSDMIAKKLDECAKWDIEDLPPKYAYDGRKVVLTDSLRAWLRETMGIEGIEKKNGQSTPEENESYEKEILRSESHLRNVVATVLDNGSLSDDEYRRLTGSLPTKSPVPYVTWWITGCFEGLITTVASSLQGQGVTREQIIDEFSGDFNQLVRITREVERLSVPDSGNG